MSALADPNREIGFGFVSCSCRACERAGEAKLREHVRHVLPQRWCLGWQHFLRRAGFALGFALAPFTAIYIGFKQISLLWAHLAWVLSKISEF